MKTPEIADMSDESSRQTETAKAILVEIAAGELIDKLSVLQIKSERITDPEKLINIQREMDVLIAARDRSIKPSAELSRLAAELKAINEKLWVIEDDIRTCESRRDFGPRFIELARGVYQTNDQRMAVKRKINELTRSTLKEEKSYANWEQ